MLTLTPMRDGGLLAVSDEPILSDAEKVAECRKIIARLLKDDRGKMVMLDWAITDLINILKFGEGCSLKDYTGGQ